MAEPSGDVLVPPVEATTMTPSTASIVVPEPTAAALQGNPAVVASSDATVRGENRGETQTVSFTGSVEGDRLTTHAAVVGRLRDLLHYEFPTACSQTAGWARGLQWNLLDPVMRAGLSPPLPSASLPRPPLVLSSPGSASRRRRQITQGLPRHEHFSSLERQNCGCCELLGCSCTGTISSDRPVQATVRWEPPPSSFLAATSSQPLSTGANHRRKRSALHSSVGASADGSSRPLSHPFIGAQAKKSFHGRAASTGSILVGSASAIPRRISSPVRR
eukprot:TRINITY_DN57745_c0_g1_i1.p1 TRINITY_DN57745_c0_g1~~TRINITY_DN57745_c0_g1_i1.p1  ORF type:complete len:275 (-),score=43.82 TRINITY_DN57745_c0_g1_i1:153-977(-)